MIYPAGRGLLTQGAARHPEKAAARDPTADASMTYGEWDECTTRVANGLLDASLGESFKNDWYYRGDFAAVVPKSGVRLIEDELEAHCSATLAEFKISEIFRILDELPKNPGGKVLKSEIVPEPLRYGIQAGSN